MLNNKELGTLIVCLVTVLIGCSDTPNNYQLNEQFKACNSVIKNTIGNEYDGTNYQLLEEYYADENNTKYIYNYIFDLNKRYLIFDGKELPLQLIFEKNSSDEWVCTYNSIKVAGIFNLLK